MSIQSAQGPRFFLKPQEAAPLQGLASITLYGLLFLMVAGPYLTLKTLPYTGEGSAVRQIAFTAVYIAAIAAARVGANPHRFLALPLSLGVTLIWFWLSMAWAVDPGVAVRRLILTTLIVMTVFTVVDIVGYKRTLHIFREVMIVILIANFLCVILLPSVGIHAQLDIEGFGLDPDLIGTWKGVLTQKNFAGAICALTIMAFVFDANDIKTWIRWAVILGSVFFLYKTHAKTSFGMVILALGAGWAFQWYNPKFRPLLIPGLLLLGLLVVVLSIVHWSDIEAVFSRPDNFTGRVHIWSKLLAYWKDHWLLGSGYGSFWNIGNNKSPLYHYVRETDWVALVAIGHNGYIDLLVQTGLPGLVLVVLSTIIIPFIKLFGAVQVDRAPRALLASFLVFCVGHNLTETSILDRDSIVGILLILTIALIGVVSRRQPPSWQHGPVTQHG